jgi:uncharacterized membrane protein YjjB (DUF3815 family)
MRELLNVLMAQVSNESSTRMEVVMIGLILIEIVISITSHKLLSEYLGMIWSSVFASVLGGLKVILMGKWLSERVTSFVTPIK